MSKNYTDKDVYHMISKYQKTNHKKYNEYINRYTAAKRCSKDTESGLMAMLIYDMRLDLLKSPK